METLLQKHRKEQRDLQSRITQKKKAATKKTRKGVNDECAALERDLKDQQDREIVALSAPAAPPGTQNGGEQEQERDQDQDQDQEQETVADKLVEASDRMSELRVDEPREAADTATTTSAPTSQQAPRKANRQKARLARRAAEQEAAAAEAAAEAASMPDLRRKEREALVAQFEKRGLRERVVRADGHCLYSAVADQMGWLGVAEGEGEGYRVVRRRAAEWIGGHAAEFAPFLEEPVEEYVGKVRDTAEWGGHMELLALARSYGVRINVLHGDGRVDAIEPAAEGEAKAEGEREVWLAYYKHGFGLGEHYNSLRKVA